MEWIRLHRLLIDLFIFNSVKNALLISINSRFQIARVISFSREIPNSYIEMERVSVDRDFEMTFKIKTEEPEGLLFYATDDTTDQVSQIN